MKWDVYRRKDIFYLALHEDTFSYPQLCCPFCFCKAIVGGSQKSSSLQLLTNYCSYFFHSGAGQNKPTMTSSVSSSNIWGKLLCIFSICSSSAWTSLGPRFKILALLLNNCVVFDKSLFWPQFLLCKMRELILILWTF